MSNVVSLGKIGEPRIWVCECGCSTFEILEDRTCRCAVCGLLSEGMDGSWYQAAEVAPEKDDPPVRDVQGNGSVEFARHRLRTLAASEDTVLLIVAQKSGGVSAWGDYRTASEQDWMLERIDSARGLIERQKVK